MSFTYTDESSHLQRVISTAIKVTMGQGISSNVANPCLLNHLRADQWVSLLLFSIHHFRVRIRQHNRKGPDRLQFLLLLQPEFQLFGSRCFFRFLRWHSISPSFRNALNRRSPLNVQIQAQMSKKRDHELSGSECVGCISRCPSTCPPRAEKYAE